MPYAPFQRDQIIGFVRDFRARSDRDSARFKQKLPRYYELWRGLYTGTAGITKNDVHLPLIFSTIQTDIARKMATSFGQNPPLTFVGYGPDDAAIARKHDSLIAAQLQDANVIRKEYLTHLRADLYGRAVSRIMWDHKEEIQTRETWKALPLSGDRIRQIQKAKVVTFDGPNYEPVDSLDCFHTPGYIFEDDMPGYAIRYYLTLEAAEFMASEAGGNVFDATELARLRQEQATNAYRQDEALISRFTARTGWASHPESDKNIPVIEVIEYYGLTPRGLVAGTTNSVISVANDRYLLRAKDTPFRNRKKPIISTAPTLDPSYYWCPGKAEVAEKMQLVANRFINQQLDAADLVIHPVTVYDQRKLVNPRNAMTLYPGKGIAVNGPANEVFAPLQFDMRGLSVGASQVGQMWQFLQMGSGIIDDAVMGMQGGGGSDRQTAREFVGRREAAGGRLMLESMMYESMYLEPLGNWFASLNSYLLQVPREVLILGDAAKNDPVTGQPIQTTRETINGWDLGTQYSARATGSELAITKTAKQQNDLVVFQTLASAQPLIAGSFNMVNFLRQMLRNLDYHNVNELIQKQPDVADMLERSGIQGGAAGVPGMGMGDPNAPMMPAMAGEGGPAIAGMIS